MSDRVERVRQALAMRDADYAVSLSFEDVGHLLHQYDRLRADLAAMKAYALKLDASNDDYQAEIDRLHAELAAKDARIEQQNAIIHGMQDGALVRDQMGLIERLHKRVAELEALEADALQCANVESGLRREATARAEQAEAQLAEAKEQVHYANGVAELAMKHRDAAEAKRDAMREALVHCKEVLEGNFEYRSDLALRKARAALNPSPGENS